MQPKEYDCKYAYAVKFHERVSRHLLGETIPLKAEAFHSVEPVPFQLAAAGKYRPISEGESWGEHGNPAGSAFMRKFRPIGPDGNWRSA